jgi:dipeptidyl aminopeptidase B
MSLTVQQWRWSSHYNLWLFDVVAKRVISVSAEGGPSTPPLISNVAFAPAKRGSTAPPSLAFVSKNDLYFLPSPTSSPIRITFDGAETVFNAVPDWVYEEEVFGSDSAMWFSPDGSKLAYLHFDETKVPIYDFPIYNPDQGRPGQTTPYLKSTKMKYPKPGYPNPIVSVHVVDVKQLKGLSSPPNANDVLEAKLELSAPGSSSSSSSSDDADVDDALAGSKEKRESRLITEVAWVSNDDLLVRESNRGSDRARVLHFNVPSSSGSSAAKSSPTGERQLDGRVVRRISTVKEGGWIEVVSARRDFPSVNFLNARLTSPRSIGTNHPPSGIRH